MAGAGRESGAGELDLNMKHSSPPPLFSSAGGMPACLPHRPAVRPCQPEPGCNLGHSSQISKRSLSVPLSVKFFQWEESALRKQQLKHNGEKNGGRKKEKKEGEESRQLGCILLCATTSSDADRLEVYKKKIKKKKFSLRIAGTTRKPFVIKINQWQLWKQKSISESK